MGSRLSRSSSQRMENSSKKRKKTKDKRRERMETSTADMEYVDENKVETSDFNGDPFNNYGEWNQEHARAASVPNFNLASTPNMRAKHSDSPQTLPNEMVNPTWSYAQDQNAHYYQSNDLTMAAASLNNSYDPNQYGHIQAPSSLPNQPQHAKLDERPSRKVQFANSPQPSHGKSGARAPLASTQSWQEPTLTITNGLLMPIVKLEAESNTLPTHRSLAHLPTGSSSSSDRANEPRSIYVHIDHRATLAERGQSTVTKHHQKSGERSSAERSDSTGNAQRTRPHTHHSHKHHESGGSPTPKVHTPSSRPHESLQVKLSGPQRPTTTTSTSTSASAATAAAGTPIKLSNSRSHRHRHSSPVEQQSLVSNEMATSRTKGNQHSERSQQRQLVARTHSPLRAEKTSSTRRTENRQAGTPVMTIALPQQIPSQQHKQQRPRPSPMSSTAVPAPSSHRARV